jgi:hypothetical protein
MGMSAVIGALRVVLGMDTAQYEAGADKAKATTSALHGALGGLGAKFAGIATGAAVGTAAVTAFSMGMKAAAEAAQYADDIAAQAYKLGVSAEYLQKFSYAAEASDVPAEAAKEALLGLSGAIGALQTRVGDGKIRKAMEALGISQEQIQSFRTAQDALPVLADKISALGTVTEQLQFAKKFGIEALLPLLKQGAQGIEGLMGNAERLGLVLDEGVINRLADMNERLRVTDEQAKAASRGLGGSFTPALVAMKEAAIQGIKWLDQMIDRFNKLGDRSAATLEKQISEKREKLRQQVIHGAGDSGMADYLRAEIAELEEAMRNNNRAAMRRKAAASAAAPASAPAAEYGGGSGSKSRPSAEDLARSDGRYAGGGRSIGVGYAVSDVDDRTVVDLEESAKAAAKKAMEPIKATYESSVGDGSLQGHLDAMARAKGQLQDGYRYAIEGGLYAAIHGGGKGLMRYLADEFQRGFAESLADGLSKVLADVAGGSKGSGWASFAKSIASAFSIGQNANGTTNWRGGLTLVGERGAELVNLPRGSQVIPNHALGGMGGGGQLLTVQVDKSKYFDVLVQQATQPMVEQYGVAAAEGGAALAENNMATKRRTTLGSGRR